MFHVQTCHKRFFCAHKLPCFQSTNVPKYVLPFTHALPLYFTCKRDMRCILYFTHVLRLYSIQWTLLNSKPILWYLRRAVWARILYCAIFCAILHISACSLGISYNKCPSTTLSTTTTITTYTLISASLWTSPGPFPWWRCLTISEECQL